MFIEAASKIAGLKIYKDEPMRKHVALGVGGNADYYVETESLYSLNALVNLTKEKRIKYKVIGNGTNLLVSDKGYKGLVICTKRLNDVFFKRNDVRAMAGASLEKLIKFNAEHKLSGFEALTGIPASIGGAVAMNAGAFGRTVSDFIVEVETLINGKIKKYSKEECEFTYRGSKFLNKKEIIVSATFSFQSGERETITKMEKAYADIRKNKQPSGKSCGSVFKNPKGISAGELIEKANLKGVCFGGAKVSEKHANFILTSSTATADDVYNLILYIKEKIQKEFGVTLTEEVEYLGEF